MTVKYAQSLDGRLATAGGESKWISGSATLRLAHELRAEHDAVLVGIGTVLADDPRLTVRLVEGPNPVRVVVDTHFRTPLTAALLSEPGDVIIATGSAAGRRRALFESTGVPVLCLPGDGGLVDLGALLRALVSRGIKSVLVEGGARVITSLLRLHLVDRMVVVLAPRLLGAGKDAIKGLAAAEGSHGIAFADASFTVMGDDLVFTGAPVWPYLSQE